jgi:pyruvate dehydrogenase E2 component (dihydrolipoamide acetyltransferase)
MAAPHPTKAKSRSSRSARAGAVPRTARKRVVVADYAGQPAADAADAVRAADLLPAPERVEVDDPALHGLVMEHDPPPGSDATRGATVTLYVGAAENDAAPPTAPPMDDPAPAPPEEPAILSQAVAPGDAPPPQAGTEDEFGLEHHPHDPTHELTLDDIWPSPADDEPDMPRPFDELEDEQPAPRRPRRKRVAAALVVIACVLIRALPLPHAPDAPKPRAAAVKPAAPRPLRPGKRRPHPRHTQRPRRAPRRRRPRTRTDANRPPSLGLAPAPSAPEPPATAPSVAPPAPVAPAPLAPDAYDEFF